MFYLNGLSIDPTQGPKCFPERRQVALCLWIVFSKAHENANASHLLRPRFERPSECRATEKCDELPSPHELPSPPEDHTLPYRWAKAELLCITAK
jgi:hypothetical protein